jgi:hypothetical protein
MCYLTLRVVSPPRPLLAVAALRRVPAYNYNKPYTQNSIIVLGFFVFVFICVVVVVVVVIAVILVIVVAFVVVVVIVVAFVVADEQVFLFEFFLTSPDLQPKGVRARHGMVPPLACYARGDAGALAVSTAD